MGEQLSRHDANDYAASVQVCALKVGPAEPEKERPMHAIEVFDRPLCCSTGICGPSVDPALVRFAADLDWIRGQGVEVRRHNLAFEPGAFTRHDDVKEALQAGQVECRLLVRVDGRILSQGRYPAREELAGWCGVAAKGACCAPGCCY